MASSFDDPELLAAMTAFVEATLALEVARSDVEVLRQSEATTLAGLVLRKRLVDLGWSAPAVQRSAT